MSTADSRFYSTFHSRSAHYRRGIEFSTIRAELAQSDELRRTWLLICESYKHLRDIDERVAADEALELAIPTSATSRSA